MKLPEVLKYGIENGDWKIICKLYTSITGELIRPPTPTGPDWSNFDIDIAIEAELLAAEPTAKTSVVSPTTLPDDINVEDSISSDIAAALVQQEEAQVDLTRPPKTGGDKPTRKEQMSILKDRPNDFVDHPSAFANQMVDKDPRYGAPVSDRGGRTGGLVAVKCSVCNKEESVSIALSHGYNANAEKNTYKCNECCSSRGASR